jgi:signal transduction histidine kinase
MEKNSVCADDIKLTSPVALYLLSHAEEILSSWEKRIRVEIKGADSVAKPILIDTLPLFISNLAQALDAHHPRSLATDSSTVAQEHGGERARVTSFAPAMILQEYQILREVLLASLEQAGYLNQVIGSVIIKSFDQAIQEAMTAYFLVHQNLRDQFVATLTHDLRNPISAAMLSTQLLLKRLNADGPDEESLKLKQLADRAVRNLQRGDSMIQYLLDSTQIQSGETLTRTLGPGNLGDLVKQILEDLSAGENIRIKTHIDSVPVNADIPQIRRAIENLISNAIKYSKDGTPISVKVSECLGRAMVSVHNEGDCIPVQEQERIFQRFQRSSSAAEGGKRGWGLGLAFVRGICEAHGGSVGVDSSAETGTTFTIDIPADGCLVANGKALEPGGESH